jgi:hypothetical protein
MEDELPPINVGIPDFESARTERCVYVDKTRFLPMLEEFIGPIFLARPRRFGKSLLVSALDAYFSKRADLFDGLDAYGRVSSPGFTGMPVISLDMSAVAGNDNVEDLNSFLMHILNKNARRHGVPLSGDSPPQAFRKLMIKVSQNGKREIALLVDEYDAPVVKALQSPSLKKIAGLADDTRQAMGNLYSQIKSSAKCLGFVLVTGVTKFSRTSVFSSELNNLTDISLEPEFGAIAGFTQEELETSFGPLIDRLSARLGKAREEVLEQIRDMYYGFSFDGETRLYNPFAIAQLLEACEFSNYWMDSGSVPFVRDFLKEHSLVPETFRMMKVTEGFLRNPGMIDRTPPEGYLYQAGYLTVRSEGPETNKEFFLDYPNSEVFSSVSRLFLENFYHSPNEAFKVADTLKKAVLERDVPSVVRRIMSCYSTVCRDDHSAFARQASESAGKRNLPDGAGPVGPAADDGPADVEDAGESLYKGLLSAFLSG